MRITILALGSRGDVFPYATLGRALVAAGHRVTLATFLGFEKMVTGLGLAFQPVQGDAESILSGGSGIDLAESGRNPLRAWRAARRSFGALARDYARDFTPLLDRPTDLIINQLPGGLYGTDLAEKLGVPMLLAAVMPLTRTVAFPMLAFPPRFAPLPGYNRLTYFLAEQLVWTGFRGTINEWREDVLGLPRLPYVGAISRLHQQRTPVLNGFSGHVVSRPPDWGDHVHITGYWFPEEQEWQPDSALSRFLEAGPPPIFVGFGSMPVRRPEELTRLIYEAFRMSGQRGILHTGWAGLASDASPENVFTIEYAPYGWLFPRMAAVVHHGGAGTIHFGLRAGVPSLVIPFLFDQFYWGGRVADLGVGPDPLPFKTLRAEELAMAIGRMVEDETMQHRAAALGGVIRADQGISEAVALVERYGR